MAKGDDIQERLINFAVRVIKICDNMPNSRSGRHIAGQLLRSGTSPAAHYAEARSAESKSDFIHKLKLCLKELNETKVWIIIITRSELLSADNIHDVNQECIELSRIINASIKTSRKPG